MGRAALRYCRPYRRANIPPVARRRQSYEYRHFRYSHALLAAARRWPRAVRRVPAPLRAARGAARALLRAGAKPRRDRAIYVWPFERFLRGPDREEAAEPFPARHAGAVVRHGRLQPCLQVLPELGHEQVARNGHACRLRVPRRTCVGGARPRLCQCRLHLQRSDSLHGVRDRRRAGLSRGGREDRRGDRRLHVRGASRRFLSVDRRRQRRPEGIHRALLSQGLRIGTRAGARYARLPEA